MAEHAEIVVIPCGAEPEREGLQLVWGHGWGQDHRALLPLAEAATGLAPSLLLDFPGFGQSPPPPGPWGTADYADAVAARLQAQPAGKRIWIGHSFGCRVGLQLAARHPTLIDAMLLIAGAGLPRRRSLGERLRLKMRVWRFKTAKLFVPEGPGRDRLRQRFGSADYRMAGPMRGVFLNVIREDLSDVARRVACPVKLLYGEKDTETPPEIGERLQTLLPQGALTVLSGFDHYTLLSEGRHQVLMGLKQLVEVVRTP